MWCLCLSAPWLTVSPSSPPSHQPLMQRVQLALQAQLTRQNEKLEVELREKVRMYCRLEWDQGSIEAGPDSVWRKDAVCSSPLNTHYRLTMAAEGSTSWYSSIEVTVFFPIPTVALSSPLPPLSSHRVRPSAPTRQRGSG